MNIWTRWSRINAGYTHYVGKVMSLLSQTGVIYALIIRDIPVLSHIFPTFAHFALPFWLVFPVLLDKLGSYHFSPKRDRPLYESQMLQARASPWIMDLSRAFIMLANGHNEAAAKVMEKWAR